VLEYACLFIGKRLSNHLTVHILYE
jgi:hypothetical protein